MTNLTSIFEPDLSADIVLTHYETAQFGIKIDEKTSRVWAITRDLPEIIEIPRSTLQRHLFPGPNSTQNQELLAFLRGHGLSTEPIIAKIVNSRDGQAWSIEQIECMAEFYGSKVLENTRTFGLNSKLLASVGYKSVAIKPADQQMVQPQQMATPLELAEAAVKHHKLEAATANLPGLANINKSQTNRDRSALPGYFSCYEELKKRFDDVTVNLIYRTVTRRMGQAARLHSAAKPRAKWVRFFDSDGTKKLTKVNEYNTDLMPEFDEVVRLAVFEVS
jgi:hypothetical protein